MPPLFRFVLSCSLSFLVPLAATAQERPNTILVLDGSGSMWGQIDGINKIVIAREVVADILADFPADQNLGLTVYGHRTRGDCADIETVVAPGTDNRSAILDAVNAINPRGMTPMTDSVIAAAEALRYTEQAATVILVSDGIETCNPNVCEAARVLEEAGIDFTAHVVGFDVTEADALAQMQCIADETGGQFLTASNADELAAALTRIATAPEPEAILGAVSFQARRGTEEGPMIETPLNWTLSRDGVAILDDGEGNPLGLDLEAASYEVTVYDAVTESSQDASFSISTPDIQTLTFVFPDVDLTPVATLTAADTGPAGSQLTVGWTGPGNARDYIAVAAVGDESYVNYSYIEAGNPLDLLMPTTPGAYELRYHTASDGEVIATRPITVTEVSATLTAPDTAIAGEPLSVGWTGPDYDRDYISVGRPGESGYVNYVRVSEGNPVTLPMPTEPGQYELRYQLEQDGEIIATRPITVTDVQASLTAPDTAVIGEPLSVGWTGPDYDRDYISVGRPGESGYVNYVRVSEGNPVTLPMPTVPGQYELRYQLEQDGEIIATRPITVTDVQASLTAPDTAVIGEPLSVGWTGPDYDRDYISVGRPGESGYVNYVRVSEGNPVTLPMPTEPGQYELRYQLEQDGEIIATRPITVTDLKVTIMVPAEAPVGSIVMVAHDGPDYPRDYVSVGVTGESGYINYTRTDTGNPTALVLPTEPGTYSIRYQLEQDGAIIGVSTIVVTPVTVRLVVQPNVALSAETVTVGWDGPDYPRDYISIGEVGAEGYIAYVRTSEGNPATLRLPAEPGDYEVRYQLEQDGHVMVRVPITVTAD